MTTAQIEERLKALEAKVEFLTQKVEESGTNSNWLDDVVGSFAGCKEHETAMKLGRQYRESLRPKVRKRRNVRPRH